MNRLRPKPAVSVVVPVLNRELFIRRCLDSVFAQELAVPFEVIVVDNGSSDGTLDAVSSYSDLVICHQTVPGPGAARNLGVAVSRGDLVAFLDSDDVMLPGRLQTQWQYMTEHPEIELCFGATRLHSNPAVPYISGVAPGEGWTVVRDPYRTLMTSGGEFVNTVAVMLRKAAFQQAGGFDPDLRCAEDTDLWLRMAGDSNFAFCSTPLSYVDDLHGDKVIRSPYVYLHAPLVIVREVADNSKLSRSDLTVARRIARKSARMMLGYLWRRGLSAEYSQRRAMLQRAFGTLYVLRWDLLLSLPRAVGEAVYRAKRKLGRR